VGRGGKGREREKGREGKGKGERGKGRREKGRAGGAFRQIKICDYTPGAVEKTCLSTARGTSSNYTVSQKIAQLYPRVKKKQDIILLPISLLDVDRLSKFFRRRSEHSLTHSLLRLTSEGRSDLHDERSCADDHSESIVHP